MLIGWITFADGRPVASGQGLDEAVARRGSCDYLWLRVAEPSMEEFRAVAEEFALPPLAVEDAVHAHQRPKLECYEQITFVVLKPGRYDDRREAVDIGELHVFLGADAVITVRHGDAEPLDEALARLEAEPAIAAHGPGAVLHAVADHIVDDYLPIVRELQRDIDQIEQAVFDVQEQPPTPRIYQLIRQVIGFQRAAVPLVPALDQLAGGGTDLADSELAERFRDVADHCRHVVEQLEGFRHMLDGALQSNVALISLRENEDQRKMSAWAAIALVPTVLGGLWGMNFVDMPLLDEWYGYPLAIGLMVALCCYLYWRFRHNGWL